jgi:transposase, IS5 family
VQTVIHHPTDRGLLVDGVRVLTRLLRQAKPLVGAPLVGAPLAGGRDAFRSRLRTARRQLHQLHRLRRRPSSPAQTAAQQRVIYQALLTATRQTIGQAVRVQAVRVQAALAALALLLPAEPAGQESQRHLAPAIRRQLSGASYPAPAIRRGVRLHEQFNQFLPLIERVIERVIAQARHRASAGPRARGSTGPGQREGAQPV